MYKIARKKEIGNKVHNLEIYAPEIAKNAKAGQFVIFRIDDKGERVPLTVAGTNPQEGLVRIIFQETGKSTTQLASLCEGDSIKDFAGPLGHPTVIKNYGTVVAVAGGVGAAELLPVIKELKKAGNKVITIVGARCKDLLILEEDLKQESDNLLFATNDGTCGIKGFVTDILKEVMSREKVNIVYAIGPVPMMKAVSELTKGKHIETVVSLNPIMLDGTGMCGACRVTVDGKTKFACVDGPEFDAHCVHWDELSSRLNLFKDLEKISLDNFTASRECKCHKK
ncbi:MAG: sulfide/dihydroorotate dehydrogenase-like FAD/NAD-binding protein [Endomicrobium sp.]|jgi:ferredoxin--NADP+ reductase|nr:sulfide/dihydroorotate dehydrogenase-like FAD/NAD-binding protein [Endomicrobium sp.]MDR2398840.1 sulfide/dihydroorotate dehydrogenase-like FAD/NAD-binding protein [Endomicrobium sp.]